jgi:hypothetical protein
MGRRIDDATLEEIAQFLLAKIGSDLPYHLMVFKVNDGNIDTDGAVVTNMTDEQIIEPLGKYVVGLSEGTLTIEKEHIRYE